MDNLINSEIIIKRKMPLIIIRITTIIYTVLIFMFIMVNILTYEAYYDNYYTVEKVNNNHLLKVSVNIKDINKVIKHQKLIIDSIEYNYQINNISENIKIINNENYLLILLDINLNNEIKLENLIIKGKIKIKEEKLINYLINIFRKE